MLEAQSAAPFSFDSAGGRLPKDVVPVLYRIDLQPDAKAHVLMGTETIEIKVRAPTDIVQLNSANETLRRVRLDGQAVKDVVSDDTKQLTTITPVKRIAAGMHSLSFSYRGRIETQPHGLFAQSYPTPGGGKGILLVTQFEATDARRMFPCWDEPAFRARFALRIVVPAQWTAVSNMPVASRVVRGDRATVTFDTSPNMPSYLVELTAGDIARIGAVNDGTQFGVWAVRGEEQDGKTALDNAQQILADYNEYFGIRYPLPKLDSIAIPVGFDGAMENWGAITYNAEDLLLNSDSTTAERQDVYSTQAHEMAHQWFGDLVTMGWWDDVWLNESFASWLAAKETDRRNPGWKWWEHEDAGKERAMRADSNSASHPIQQRVENELQADNAFDPEITYDKGQAVLRMLEAYIGPSVFRDGIHHYLEARAYSNATAADLWNALSAASGQDIGAIAVDWTTQAGFPQVDVTASCDQAGARTIGLTEKRFLLRGMDERKSAWRVPLQIREGAAARARSLLFSGGPQSVPAGRCDEPLSVDAEAVGFYRVKYDAATLAINARAFASLPDGDRIALLDDGWALVEADQQPLESYLILAAAMGGNLDARAWQEIEHALNIIEYAERGSPSYAAFLAYARSLVRPAADRLGWDARPGETPDIQELRRTLIGDLGAWGDPAVSAEARRRYEAFLKDHKALSPDDQKLVLGIVMRTADQTTFSQVHELAKGTSDQAEIARYYLALALVRDPVLATQIAEIAVSAELLGRAPLLCVQIIFALAREHPQLAWSTFSGHVDQVMDRFPGDGGIILTQYVPTWIWDAVPPDELESWIKAHVPAELAEKVAPGMQRARFMLSEKEALRPAADAFLGSRGGR
jgi:aminopeptidase N